VGASGFRKKKAARQEIPLIKSTNLDLPLPSREREIMVGLSTRERGGF